MVDLSPAAQAVLDALNKTSWDWASMEQASPQTIAAAALRAAADEVVPVPIVAETPGEHWTRLGIKNKLLAIADELEEQ